MKKLFVLALSIAVVMFFTGCGALLVDDEATNSSDGGSASSVSVDVVSSADSNQNIMNDEGNIDDYHIKIISAQKGKDYKDQDAVIVTYEWTNNSDGEQMFSTAFDASVYQNGVECETAIMMDDIDNEKSLTNIKPGASLEVKQAYVLNDNSDIEVEVTAWISFDDDEPKVVKTFTLE